MYEDRMTLWRRTLYLFEEFKHNGWKGPFLRANYKRQNGPGPPYIIERQVLDFKGNTYQPDVIASSDTSWSIVDLTLNDDSKAHIFLKYGKINPSSLRNHGMNVPSTAPELMSSRLKPSNEFGFTQLIVSSIFSIVDLDAIKDSVLKGSLAEMIGADLSKIPQIPITILPESPENELREGILPTIMKMFDPHHPTFTVSEIVDMGLERLSEVVSIGAKKSLIDRVQSLMESLYKGPNAPLKDWLIVNENKYSIREELTSTKPPRSISQKLSEWANKTTSTLDEFT